MSQTKAELINAKGDAAFDTDTLYIDSTNNRVGVGSTSPSRQLQVQNLAGSAIASLVSSTSGNCYLFLGDTASDAPGRIGYLNSEDALTFWSNAGERGRFDSSGRLLVGTSSYSGGTRAVFRGNTAAAGTQGVIVLQRDAANPSTTQSLGEIRFVDSNDGWGASISAEGDATWSSPSDCPTKLVFSTTADGASSPTERMRISQNGALRVPAAYTLTTGNAANCSVQSDGTFQRSTSSIKYKTNVEDLDTSYTDALLSCRPVWYRSTSESDNPNYSYWGFIAEEVAEIDPRLVHWKTVEITYDEKGSVVETPCEPEPEGVQYDRFVPHLLNLIKRQKEQIEALEARLTAAGI